MLKVTSNIQWCGYAKTYNNTKKNNMIHKPRDVRYIFWGKYSITNSDRDPFVMGHASISNIINIAM